jgi:putative nucleotidyltransferase with HDIG domain
MELGRRGNVHAMAEPSVAHASARESLLRGVIVALTLAVALCVAIAAFEAHLDHVNSLTAVLGIGALVAGLAVVPAHGRASISASFIVALLAASFLGPASACAAAAVSELAAARRMHTTRLGVMANLFASLASALSAANLIRAIAPAHNNTGLYCLSVLAGAAVYVAVSYVIVAPIQQLAHGDRAWSLEALVEYLPSLALNVGLTVAGAGVYLKIGFVGIAFALAAVFAFSYMAHLLEQTRHRAEQYVSLSWGVLAGLMRSLDIRDQRAARHAAAVARFARDMARAVGMEDQECELAHTAGLLHDIGHFALSDRVAERGRTLTDEDWVAIQRHPELGADMLRDLGMYGPVAEIVAAHHERVDGRGYPQGLEAEEIPEIAKIISVAEVYDTLTASDTYRTPMSSFEALNELRRVADNQLDSRYVEVLASLLSGEGVAYRHANAADFDTELDMERRINEAGAR